MSAPLSTHGVVRVSITLALCLALSFAIAATGAHQSPTQPATQPATQPTNRAIIPVPRDQEKWRERNQALNDRAKQGNIDLLFLGDSITQAWDNPGGSVWEKYYAQRNAANFGISGDRTEHVLWRITHGNLAGLEKDPPKLIVLMIGTNNSGDEYTAQDVADGIIAIVKTLREKLPSTKVLLLAIFPRGQTPDARRAKNAQASAIASKVADGKDVIFLDIGASFMNADGTISKDIMPDSLHLSDLGYLYWAKAIEPTVKQVMGD
jgi:beta-glucosidase